MAAAGNEASKGEMALPLPRRHYLQTPVVCSPVGGGERLQACASGRSEPLGRGGATARRARGEGRQLEVAWGQPILSVDARLLLAALGRGDEVHGAAAAAGDAHRPGEENAPAAVGPLAVGLHDDVLLVLPEKLPVVQSL